MDFPQIAKPYFVYSEQPEDPGISSQMEDGIVISGPRFSKSRLSFYLKWTALSSADKATLLNFYRNQARGCSCSFNWPHSDPNSEFYNTSFEVRFMADSSPKFEKVSNNKWSTEITLVEV